MITHSFDLFSFFSITLYVESWRMIVIATAVTHMLTLIPIFYNMEHNIQESDLLEKFLLNSTESKI